MKKKLNLSIIILGISLLSSTAQIYPVRPQLSDKHSFSMILLPDPQSYNKFDANQPLFELQTAWVANSIEPLNIKGVLCTGDLVEQNEIRIPDGINGNQTSEEQWQAAAAVDAVEDGEPTRDQHRVRCHRQALSVFWLPAGRPDAVRAGRRLTLLEARHDMTLGA